MFLTALSNDTVTIQTVINDDVQSGFATLLGLGNWRQSAAECMGMYCEQRHNETYHIGHGSKGTFDDFVDNLCY